MVYVLDWKIVLFFMMFLMTLVLISKRKLEVGAGAYCTVCSVVKSKRESYLSKVKKKRHHVK